MHIIYIPVLLIMFELLRPIFELSSDLLRIQVISFHPSFLLYTMFLPCSLEDKATFKLGGKDILFGEVIFQFEFSVLPNGIIIDL